VETRVLAGPNGSARVQIVGSTDVLVAVKAELNSVEKGEQLVQNRIKFFVDISANASPKFAGRGGNELGEEMARTFHTAFDNDLVLPDMRKLVLAPTHCWLLHVDVLILQYGGNAMDAISLGVSFRTLVNYISSTFR
jgi:exosome complex component RRP42